MAVFQVEPTNGTSADVPADKTPDTTESVLIMPCI